jgi:hypothetical protein
MKAILGLVMAAALVGPAMVTPAGAAISVTPAQGVTGPTILVEGGCGRDYHRIPDGRCVPNWREWEPGWRACPPGWHLGAEGRRCWPN